MKPSFLDFEPRKSSGPLPRGLEPFFDSETSQQVVALIDAAQVIDLPLLLENSGLDHVCLFDGEAQAELAEVAPWLVRLSPDATFTSRMFTQGDAPWDIWGKARFALLRTDRPLSDLKAHFKRFVRPQVASGSRQVMFRFWDAQILADYIEGTQDEPWRAERLLSDRTGWICKQLALCTSRTPSLSLYTPPDTAAPAPAPFTFDAQDHTALRHGVEQRMVRDIAERLGPKFESLAPGGSGFAKDHAIGAFRFVRENTPANLAVTEDDCFQLALLGYLMGTEKQKVLNGPVMSERLVPISHRIALVRQSYFEALKQISEQET